MGFPGAIPLRRQCTTSTAIGDTALAGRFAPMAERGDVVMYGTEVGVGMIIARPDVVDPVGAAAAAQMTDPPMIPQYPLALRVPFPREANATI